MRMPRPSVGGDQYVNKSLLNVDGNYYSKSKRKQHSHVMNGLVASAKEVVFLPVSVCLSPCLSVNRITEKLLIKSFMQCVDIIQVAVN